MDFKALKENITGRDYIVGDIHGAYSYLEEALEQVGFCPETDRLISVGDLINGGLESHRCLEFLQKPWFHAIKGNHEDLFLNVVSKDGELNNLKAKFNIYNEMSWIIDLTRAKRQELYVAFSQLPVAMEIQTEIGMVGVVHANVPNGMSWKKFTKKIKKKKKKVTKDAMWGRSRIKKKNKNGVKGIERVFFGHTKQKHGPTQLGNCYYIDTGAVSRMLYGNEVSRYFTLTMLDITVRSDFPSKLISKPDNNVNVITLNMNKPENVFKSLVKKLFLNV